MKKIFIFLLFLYFLLNLDAQYKRPFVPHLIITFDGIGFGSTGCGYHPYYNGLCGYNISIAPACPGGATDINAAGLPYTIPAAGNYKLTASAGADATADQIIFSGFVSGQVTICLDGFTLTGRINITGRAATGITIERGIVNCTFITGSGANLGCLRLSPSTGTWTGAITVDSLQITNNGAGTGTQSTGALNLDTGSMGTVSSMPNPAFVFKNLTLTGGSNTTATRIATLNLVSAVLTQNLTLQLRNIKFVTSANANAANCAQLYGSFNFDINGVYCDMSATVGMSTLPRGLAFDGQDNNNNAGGIIRNYVANANEGRPFRCRGCSATLLDGFYFQNIQSGGTEGAIHLCDNDNLKGQAVGPIYIQNGTLEIGTGTGFYVRGCDYVLTRNIKALCATGCASGKMGSIGPIVNDETQTVFNIQHINFSGSIGTGWVLGTGTVTSQCDAGAAFTGTVSPTTLSPCP